MAGRTSRTWLVVTGPGLSGAELNSWVPRGVAVARSLSAQ